MPVGTGKSGNICLNCFVATIDGNTALPVNLGLLRKLNDKRNLAYKNAEHNFAQKKLDFLQIIPNKRDNVSKMLIFFEVGT